MIHGLPNSLLNTADQIGASSIISKGLAIWWGLPTLNSQGRWYPGIKRSDTLNPASPAFGLDHRPAAPSSRISPPEPVAAPGYGGTAVGWLCISTLATKCTTSWVDVHPFDSGSGAQCIPLFPSDAAALSE